LTDESGAILVGADVLVINQNTGVTSHASTSAEGDYRLPDLADRCLRCGSNGKRI
jgi:hypothetical protein